MRSNRKKVLVRQGLKKWIDKNLLIWKKRLDDSGIEFNKADEKSFLFSLAVAHLTRYSVSAENLITMLDENFTVE